MPASTPTQRRTVPSPPQAKTSSAPSASARSTCAGARLAFGTSYQSGSSTPAVRERAAQLGQPAVERLARVGDDRDLHATAARERERSGAGALAMRVRRRAGRAAGEQQDEQGADADHEAAGDVERVVHAAVHARQRDDDGQQDARRARAATRAPRALEARREQQHEAGVDRDRGGRVAGRVARVGGQVLEPRDVRALARDDDRGQPVGGRLDHEHEDREGRDPPLAHDGAGDRDEADEDRQHRRAADRRADGRGVGEERRPVGDEVADEALVVAAEPAAADQDVGDEQPAEDRDEPPAARSRRAARRRTRARDGGRRSGARSAPRGLPRRASSTPTVPSPTVPIA